MPLFFIVSGYFAHDAIVDVNRVKLIRHLRSYAQPMISVGIVLSCCSAIFGLIPLSLKDVGLYALKWILFSPWFLWTLIGVYLISFVSFSSKLDFKTVCVILLFVILFLMFIPNVFKGLLHVPAIRNMFPFFIAGMILKHYSLTPWNSNLIGGGGGLCFLLFIVFEGDVSKNGMGFYWVDSSWRGVFFSTKGIITFILRPVMGVIGALGVMWMLRQCYAYVPKINFLASLGKYTICIYLLHFWILERIIEVFPLLLSSWTIAFLLSVLLTTVCGRFGYLTMEHSRLARGILWGR